MITFCSLFLLLLLSANAEDHHCNRTELEQMNALEGSRRLGSCVVADLVKLINTSSPIITTLQSQVSSEADCSFANLQEHSLQTKTTEQLTACLLKDISDGDPPNTIKTKIVSSAIDIVLTMKEDQTCAPGNLESFEFGDFEQYPEYEHCLIREVLKVIASTNESDPLQTIKENVKEILDIVKSSPQIWKGKRPITITIE